MTNSIKRVFLSLFLLLLFTEAVSQNPYGVRGREIYIPLYTPVNTGREVALEMGYASHIIKNPEAWNNPKKEKVVYEIDLVFTQYPKEKKDWIINYDSLLTWRLREISKLDPSFVRNKFIKWNFILQTNCKTEPEAQKLFHGVVLKYFIRDGVEEKIYSDNREAKEIVYGNRMIKDSTVMKVMERNNNSWNDIMVVTDWTGTMYNHGSQLILWHRLNLNNSNVKYFSFFNDGDGMPDHKKQIGRTGGIYFSDSREIHHLVVLMTEVMRNGHGGDLPENDCEAILKSIQHFGHKGEVVLVCDRTSAIRDIEMVKAIKLPVRIILGGDPDGEVHPDKVRLAMETNGSLHTLEQDLMNLSRMANGESIELYGITYTFENGKIKTHGTSRLKFRRGVN
jgi:hypothetical protein